MGDLIGAKVKIVIIGRLVDTNSPDNDRWVISVLENHLADVLNGLILPILVANMLPTGNFGEYKQAEPIALVNEILRLGIMRRSYRINAERL